MRNEDQKDGRYFMGQVCEEKIHEAAEKRSLINKLVSSKVVGE